MTSTQAQALDPRTIIGNLLSILRSHPSRMGERSIIAEAEAYIAALPTEASEPVAWRVASSNGYDYYTFKPEDRLFPEPLYAGSANAD